MSLKVRSVLVVLVGTVLGLTVSIGSSMLALREPPAAVQAPIGDPSLELLAEALQRIRREYVNQIDDQTLIENAISGMLEGLDPHSRFLDANQYEDIRIATTGNYTGIGLDVSSRGGEVVVATPVLDAPADRAGIRAGDVVVSVDGIAVGDDREAAIGRMRGEPGTEVTLSVRRAADDSVIDFALTRAPIHVRTVSSRELPGGFGYVRVSGFSEGTLEELEAAARQLVGASGNELKGLVLDLRDNPGGVLQSAIAVADVFLDEGLIVRGNGRIRQSQFEQFASPGDALEQVPLVAVINSNSASGAEIVAGALGDHGRAELIGERSYGKGSVQSVVPLGGGNALKLTTALYQTPSGRTINGRGIDPGTVVEFDGDLASQFGGPNRDIDVSEDPQIAHALRTLGYEAIALSQAR